jgi:hypothetical protein
MLRVGELPIGVVHCRSRMPTAARDPSGRSAPCALRGTIHDRRDIAGAGTLKRLPGGLFELTQVLQAAWRAGCAQTASLNASRARDYIRDIAAPNRLMTYA